MTVNADKAVDALEKEIAELEALALEQANPPADQDLVEEKKDLVSRPTTTPEEAPLSKEEETFKKRFGDLRRHSQKKEEALQARVTELENQLKSRPAEMPIDPSKVKDWVAKYPEVASIVRAIAADEADAKSNTISSKMAEIEQLNEQLNRTSQEAKIRKAHPDFDEIIDENSNFHVWAEKQPKNIQDIIYDSLDADGVIWAIETYKNLSKKVDVNAEAAKAVNVKTKTSPGLDGGKRRFTESEVERMSMDDYAKFEEEIGEAIREGRFEYDISGAAR